MRSIFRTVSYLVTVYVVTKFVYVAGYENGKMNAKEDGRDVH